MDVRSWAQAENAACSPSHGFNERPGPLCSGGADSAEALTQRSYRVVNSCDFASAR